jgi:hypothetical protein
MGEVLFAQVDGQAGRRHAMAALRRQRAGGTGQRRVDAEHRVDDAAGALKRA